MAELLSADEHHAMDLLAELNRVMRRIVSAGVDPGNDSRAGDLREVTWHIHGLQNMVLSQAAARAYPERYRLLGGGTQPKQAAP